MTRVQRSSGLLWALWEDTGPPRPTALGSGAQSTWQHAGARLSQGWLSTTGSCQALGSLVGLISSVWEAGGCGKECLGKEEGGRPSLCVLCTHHPWSATAR